MTEYKGNHLHDQCPEIYIKLLSTQWGFVQFYMEMSRQIIPLMCQSWALSMSFIHFRSSVFQSIIHIEFETGKGVCSGCNLTAIFAAPCTFNYFTSLRLILHNYTVSQTCSVQLLLSAKISTFAGNCNCDLVFADGSHWGAWIHLILASSSEVELKLHKP